jgi:hypothetical protein
MFLYYYIHTTCTKNSHKKGLIPQVTMYLAKWLTEEEEWQEEKMRNGRNEQC